LTYKNKKIFLIPKSFSIMKKVTLIVSMITLCVGFSSSALAQVSDFASTTATIVAPITIVKDVDMNFGDIAVQGGVAGTVVMTPAGGLTPSTGITLPTSTSAAAQFTVGGEADYTYSISLPASVLLTDTVSTETMLVDAFNSTPTVAAGGTLTGGSEIVLVGATLNIAALQTPGVYSNATDLVVTVNYN
jgi:hypothetical protein